MVSRLDAEGRGGPRLVYVSTSAIPSRTANSIHVMKMSQAFHDCGADVVLLAPGNGTDIGMEELSRRYGVVGGFTIRRYRTYCGPGRSILTSMSILGEIRRLRPDAVYGRFAPACAASSLAGYPTAFEAHSPLWNEGAVARASLWLMRKSAGFRKLVVISDALKAMCLSDGVFREEEILVAHDGADSTAASRHLLGPGKRLRAGYFGHLYKGRGIEIILRAAEALPDVEFHVFGGNEEDIRHWKAATGVANVEYHGFVDPGLVPGYRQSCDILLAPYQREVAISGGSGNTSAYMSPLKIFEYMAGRRAIIVSDLPVLREVLDDGCALLAEPSDPRAWIDAIVKLRDPVLRNRLADAAHARFLEQFTWDKRAGRLLEAVGCSVG